MELKLLQDICRKRYSWTRAYLRRNASWGPRYDRNASISNRMSSLQTGTRRLWTSSSKRKERWHPPTHPKNLKTLLSRKQNMPCHTLYSSLLGVQRQRQEYNRHIQRAKRKRGEKSTPWARTRCLVPTLWDQFNVCVFSPNSLGG